VIVDGFHSDFASVRVAWRAKRRGKMFLVTDAMPPVGAQDGGFVLGPYRIAVEGGRCLTEDGVLAGSALDMATGVRNCIQRVGIPTDEALRMASTYPAEFLGLDSELGLIAPGYLADLVVFDNQINVSGVMVRGRLEEVA
jgi:N-acetylglucosamine-6-phosphate deacetylase